MTDLAFASTDIPETTKSGRTAMPNPFTEHFPSDDKALTVTVKEGRDSTEAKRLIRQARQAAKAVNRTARVDLTDAAKGAVTMKFWTVAQVTRKGGVVAPETDES